MNTGKETIKTEDFKFLLDVFEFVNSNSRNRISNRVIIIIIIIIMFFI
jgi:hypothetical protein